MTTSSNAVPVCEHCGMSHPNRTCTLIKAIEYHPNGQIKRVEFKTAQDWPQVQTIDPPWQNPVISTAAGFLA
jgi:hypothetical protein